LQRGGSYNGADRTRSRREEKMEIDRSEDRGVTVVEVRGVINFGESAREFSSYLQDLLAADVPAVLVDMSGIDHVDSTGLGELVGYLQRFEKEGRRLALYRPHRRILSLLRLTRLDEIFAIYENREEAIAELSTPMRE
jgi:anti-sigma B factor antagonist